MSAGRLFVVGLGPGGAGQMTFAARAALEACEAVVGYGAYVDLVRPLLAGKAVFESGMTEEVDRGRKAVALAREGRSVALISSGDAGVYGMAGLACEVLLAAGWDPSLPDVEVEVLPGVTAASAAAALLGAPLNHDFCCISLSSLLTPWEAIEARLRAAAEGDFVTVLYNPRSKRREWQLAKAQEILLSRRGADTPCGWVSSAYREGQAKGLCRLDELAAQPLGMLSIAIVGNSQTRAFGPLLLTPRGYQAKYDLAAKGGDLSRLKGKGA